MNPELTLKYSEFGVLSGVLVAYNVQYYVLK